MRSTLKTIVLPSVLHQYKCLRAKKKKHALYISNIITIIDCNNSALHYSMTKFIKQLGEKTVDQKKISVQIQMEIA